MLTPLLERIRDSRKCVLVDWVLSLVLSVSGVSIDLPDIPLLEAGVSSRQAVEITAAIQAGINGCCIKIASSLLYNFRTTDQIADYIEATAFANCNMATASVSATAGVGASSAVPLSGGANDKLGNRAAGGGNTKFARAILALDAAGRREKIGRALRKLLEDGCGIREDIDDDALLIDSVPDSQTEMNDRITCGISELLGAPAPQPLLVAQPTISKLVEYVERVIVQTSVVPTVGLHPPLSETNVVFKVLPEGGAVVMDVLVPNYEESGGLQPAIVYAMGSAYGGSHFTASELGVAEAEAGGGVTPASSAAIDFAKLLASDNDACPRLHKDLPGVLSPAELFCAQGFVVFVVGYRQARFADGVDDIASAVSWVQQPANAARFNVDPERVGLFGNSSGGLTAKLAGIQLGSPGGGQGVKALATVGSPFAAIADSILFQLATWPSIFATRSLGVQMGTSGLGTVDLEQSLAPLSVTAAAISVRRAPAAHILSVYGSGDAVVPVSTSGAGMFDTMINQWEAEAESAGVHHRRCTFEIKVLDRPDLDHVGLVLSNDVNQQVAEFLRLHL